MNLPLRILGTGEYLPERVVTSAEAEDACGWPRGWAERRSGVRERRRADPRRETNAFMGARAAEAALAAAGLRATDVDLVLNASGTQQQPIPDTSALVAAELGVSGLRGHSVHATCLSFLVALDTAAALLALHRARRVLIVSSDIGSVGLSPDQPEAFTLIGDGAAAVVVDRTPPDGASALHESRFEVYPEGAHHTEIPGGGTHRNPHQPDVPLADFTFRMDGPRVLRLAREHAPGFLERLRPGLSSGLGDIDVVVPHQASLAGLRLLSRFGWPEEKVESTLATLGNCVAASLPITLHRAVVAGRLRRGGRALLVGTGAGFSLGGLILTY